MSLEYLPYLDSSGVSKSSINTTEEAKGIRPLEWGCEEKPWAPRMVSRDPEHQLNEGEWGRGDGERHEWGQYQWAVGVAWIVEVDWQMLRSSGVGILEPYVMYGCHSHFTDRKIRAQRG